MRPAAATALLGLVLTLTAATFDAEPLYVPGAAFVALAAGAVLWVVAGARGVLVPNAVTRPEEILRAADVAPDLVTAVDRVLGGARCAS